MKSGYIKWGDNTPHTKDFYGLLLQVLLTENDYSMSKLMLKSQTRRNELYGSSSTVYRQLKGESMLSETEFLDICRKLKIQTEYLPISYVDKVNRLREQNARIKNDNSKSEDGKRKNNSMEARKKLLNEMEQEQEKLIVALDNDLERYEEYFIKKCKVKLHEITDNAKCFIGMAADKTLVFKPLDEWFIMIYLDLNDIGRLLLTEFLNEYINEEITVYCDDIIEACDKLIVSSEWQVDNLLTDDEILKKARGGYADSSISYSLFCLYEMDKAGWELLKTYHKIIQVRGVEAVEDMQVQFEDIVIIFMDILKDLKSCKNGNNHWKEYLDWKNSYEEYMYKDVK